MNRCHRLRQPILQMPCGDCHTNPLNKISRCVGIKTACPVSVETGTGHVCCILLLLEDVRSRGSLPLDRRWEEESRLQSGDRPRVVRGDGSYREAPSTEYRRDVLWQIVAGPPANQCWRSSPFLTSLRLSHGLTDIRNPRTTRLPCTLPALAARR